MRPTTPTAKIFLNRVVGSQIWYNEDYMELEYRAGQFRDITDWRFSLILYTLYHGIPAKLSGQNSQHYINLTQCGARLG